MALKQAAYLIFERGKKRPSLTELRRIFRNALKHYPGEFDLDRIAECKKCKRILEKKIN